MAISNDVQLPELHKDERGYGFYPTVEIPALYSGEETPFADKVIYAHYWIGGLNWYIAEYDPANGTAFGYASNGGAPHNSEWGYASLVELEDFVLQQPINFGGKDTFIPLLVQRDNYWTPKTFTEAKEHGKRIGNPIF